MNELTFAVFQRNPQSTIIAADGFDISGCSVRTQLHGGFGALSGLVKLDDYNSSKWCSEYHNRRMKVWDSRREPAWEGRLEDIEIVPGVGVSIQGFGYWRNFFDVPLKDEDTWESGTHYPEDIIEAVIDRCCRQIEKNYVNFEDTNRDVAPFKISNFRYPHDVIKELLAGGDKWGVQMFFAVWENRWPYLFAKNTDVDWYVRLADCSPPPKLRRTMDTMANIVVVEYSVEGEAGDVNDSGTGTGERGENYVTLTDTEQGWDEGQWNRGFDIAVTGGTGNGQIRDVLRTRLEPSVVDSGWCVPFRTGTTTASAGEAHNIIDENGAAIVEGQFTWRIPVEGPLWVDVVSGSCAGQQREIEDGYLANANFNVPITPDWEGEGDDGNEYPSSNTGVRGKYIVYKPSAITTQGDDWAHQEYDEGYVVEIVQGRGSGQRRKITDTIHIALTDGVWGVLKLESDWDTQPDDTSYFEIQEVAEVIETGTATGGSHNTLVDTNKTWTVDGYNDDYEVVIMKGACANQRGQILDTTADTLIVDPLWDDDVPDETSEYEIRVIREEDEEEAEEGACTQVVVTTPWTTQPDETSTYEIRQKEDGGKLERTTIHASGWAVKDMELARKRVFPIGTTTPGGAERVAGRLRAKLRDPQQQSSPFTIKKVWNTSWTEMPLVAVRAGDVIEIVDLFGGQVDTDELDQLRRFYIIRTEYKHDSPSLAITPDNVEAEIATLIASVRK